MKYLLFVQYLTVRTQCRGGHNLTVSVHERNTLTCSTRLARTRDALDDRNRRCFCKIGIVVHCISNLLHEILPAITFQNYPAIYYFPFLNLKYIASAISFITRS